MRKARVVSWEMTERKGLIHVFGRHLLNGCYVLDGVLSSASRGEFHRYSAVIQLKF